MTVERRPTPHVVAGVLCAVLSRAGERGLSAFTLLKQSGNVLTVSLLKKRYRITVEEER